jgi:hypothetical protein
VHEIIAGIFPWRSQTISEAPAETITIAKLTRIEHRAKPTPAPTPKPIVHTKNIAETHVRPQIVNPGSPSQPEHIRRIANARPIAHTRYHSKPATIHVPEGGQGAGTSKIAKVLTGGVGTGGTGSGESGNGNGTGGAPEAQEPCGYVDFEPNAQPIVDQATGRIWEHISAVVHFPDGSAQTVVLDYPFFFPNRTSDPYFPENKNVPALFQQPPPSQAAAEPPLVQYIMKHSTAEGFTRLRDCPGSTP